MYNLILSTLHDNKENGLTAREVAVILYNQGLLRSNERQATAPRLTELVDDGRVVIIGKRFDERRLVEIDMVGILDRHTPEYMTLEDLSLKLQFQICCGF